MKKYVAALLCLISSPALANDGPCTDKVPPARYAAMATPAYELITLTSQTELVRQCGGGRWDRFLACALNDSPVIYVMSDRFIADLAGDPHKGRRWKGCLLKHEEAHLNGWPGTHPAD